MRPPSKLLISLTKSKAPPGAPSFVSNRTTPRKAPPLSFPSCARRRDLRNDARRSVARTSLLEAEDAGKSCRHRARMMSALPNKKSARCPGSLLEKKPDPRQALTASIVPAGPFAMNIAFVGNNYRVPHRNVYWPEFGCYHDLNSQLSFTSETNFPQRDNLRN